VALGYIQNLLNNYQNVESFRKGYLELNKRNIDLCDRLDRAKEINKDLLDACERDALLANIAIAETPTGDLRNKLTEINILRIAAISKAKQ